MKKDELRDELTDRSLKTTGRMEELQELLGKTDDEVARAIYMLTLEVCEMRKLIILLAEYFGKL